MKKRVLSMFMALALCLTLLPTAAWAEGADAPKGGAAQIGDTVYSTLPEAVNAAQDGDTIKLLADYKTAEGAGGKEESGLTITKSVTLNLNGYEMDDFRVAQVNDAGATLPSGNLTVEDTSAEKTGKVTGMIELVAGKLTINGGAIGDGRDGVSIENGNLIVNGGTMDCLYGSNSGTVTITGGTVKNARVGEGFEITVTGGSGHTGLWNVSEGTWNISGGEFGEVTFLTASPAKNAPISGGTFGKITRKNLQNNTETLAPISELLADGYAFYAQAAGSKEYDQYVKLTDAISSLENVQVKGHTHNIENGVCTVCGAQMVAQDNTGKYYLSLQDAFAGVADGGTVTMLKSLENDMIRFCKDTNKKPVDKTVTLMMNGQSLSFEGASPLYVESGKLIIGDEAVISQPAQEELPAVWVDNHDQDKDRGTLEFQGKATITGGLLIQNWGKLVGGLKEGTIITNNGTYSVSVGRSETYSNVLGLLGDGLAFAKYDENAENKAGAIVNGNVKQLTEDVIVVAHTHSIEEGQSACACGKKFEASVTAEDGTITYYGTLDEAFASVKAGGTVKLMMDSDDRDRQDYIYVVGGPYTFDLNGHRVGHRKGDDFKQAFLQVGDPDGKPGTLTVLDSSTAQTGYFYELKLYNGSLTVESGSFYRYWESATTATGTMTFKGGTVDEFYATSRNVETKLYGGTFGNVYNNIGGKPGDLLADNRAFFNRGNNSFVNGYDYEAVNNVVVKDHTHTIVNGVCECGFTCAHDWSGKNGVCKKANCGYHCPHNAGATEADGVWACNTCGQTVTAKVVAPDGSTTTYYADGHVDNNVKSGLYFAIKAAKTGSTVAALGGEYSGGHVKGGKTLTLDVSNGKTIDGMLNVGYTNTGDTGDTGNTGNKLIVRGSAEISYVIVEPDNTLDLTGWTGRIVSLTVQNGGKATLNGGTFATLYINGAAAGSLLAKGYAFQNVDTGAYVECSSTADMKNVKVVKCPHSDVTLKENHTGAECKYCGASFAATLDDAPYGKIDAAVSAWLKNGGTLKLYADYTAADGTWEVGSGSHTVNLNGHKMSVQGDGNAFKPTHNMHLTVTDGTKLGQITNILLDGSQDGSFTLESGYVGNLEMTGGAVVTLKGGRVDNLDVQHCSANTNLSIQGGSLGKLNIEDWAEGMHVSATGGSLGAYTLPSGKILADVLDHQYYAEGTSLDRQVDTAQPVEKFVIKQAPHDFGSTSKVADVPINGRIPFMVDSPSGDATGYYDVMWYRRTNSGAEHMTENRVAGVNVNDKLDVLCVITGADYPGGAMKWQVAVKDYTINVVPAKLDGDRTVITQESDTGNTGNPADNRLVVTPLASNAFNYVEYKFEVTYNGQPLELNKDYTIKDLSNLAKNAGTHTLTIVGMGNYTGEKSVTWTLEPYELSVEKFCHAQINKTYDGTDAVTDSTNGIGGLNSFIPDSKNPRNPGLSVDKLNLDKSDYELSNMKFDSAEAGDRTFTGTMTLKPGGNFAFAGGSRVMQIEYGSVSGQQFVFIDRATIAAPAAKALQVANNHAATYTVDLSALLPKLESPKKYGKVTYALDTVSINGGYYDAAKGSAEVKDGKLILPIQAVKTSTESNIGTVTVQVTTTNYKPVTLTVNLRSVNKRKLGMFVSVATDPIVYGMTLGDIKLSAEATVDKDNQVIPGTIAWEDPLTTVPAAGRATYRWTFTPDDTMHYLTASNTITFLVDKATPTGAPTYTAITTGGKTLADAPLTPNASWPSGTVQWVDKDGKPLPASTQVQANTEYTWSFTPADTANYNGATGSVTLYAVSSGGGGSSSSDRDTSGGGTVKTETTKNNDGSVTKTETKKDGTVVETTTGKDGSVSKTTTNPNGSSVTETKAADGSTGTVKTDKNGQTTAETALSSKAIETAKKSGEAVKAPVEVEASRDSSTAPTVKVELPKGAGETKVEIPVSNVKPGTVAVLVHADGTEEIVKNSLPTEDGIQLTVNGGATVKIVDNSKGFIDTQDHWAEDAIDFVSARGLVNGMSATIYAPNASTTRAQLWTILARQNNADLTGGATWFENAQNWAKAKGISDGANPNGTINRAQMVTMLWRAAGSPAAQSGTAFQDVAAGSYYGDAVAWAVENGITAGVGGGRFDPNSTCTRGQIATFLYRLYLSR